MKVSRIRLSAFMLTGAVCALVPTALPAQSYPARPVRVVIAFGPGGIADTIG